MSRKPKTIALDSWSVIAYFENEKAGDSVAGIIADAHENGTSLKMSIVNVGEVWYILARQTSEHEADEGIAELSELGVEFVDADWEMTRQAAIYKSKHKMSYADCFAAALAKHEKAELLTGDNEFKQVEDDIKINWINNYAIVRS